MSCGVGCRYGLDPASLWLLCRRAAVLWCRLPAVALIWPLPWALPCAMGTALKRQKNPKKQKNKKQTNKKTQCCSGATPPWLSPQPLFFLFAGSMFLKHSFLRLDLQGAPLTSGHKALWAFAPARNPSSRLERLHYLRRPPLFSTPFLLQQQ